MSGSLNNIYNNVSFALRLHTKEMTQLQEQVSTGSRINRVSDDSIAAYQILGLNTQQSTLGNYIDNLSEVSDTLQLSSTIIQDMVSVISEVRTRIAQISSGVYTDDSRQRTADGIDELLEQIVTLANTKHMGQYIFGGGSTTSQPYQVTRTDGEITSVTYQGSYENRSIEVAPSLKSSALLVGEEVFKSNDRGELIFVGDTGAKAGTGTSSVCNDTWLTVTGSSGNYTISIDGGLTTFNTDGTDTNLAVTSSVTGEVLYIDTTEIAGPGVDLVRAPGTYDIFNTLINIREILKNENGLSHAQLMELQEGIVDSLQEMNDLLLQTEVMVGTKAGFLDGLKGNLNDLKYDNEDEKTRLEEADIAQIAIDLSRREVLYEMSLSIAGKLMSMSLLDFLS